MIRSPLVHMPLKHKAILAPMLAGIVCLGLYVSWQWLASERVTPLQKISSPLPAPSLAITAHFELGSDNERSGNLLLTVWARPSQKQGDSIPVKLILRRLKNGFLQNHHVNVTNGEASAPYIHGFTSIPLDEPIHIIAEASLRDQHGQYKRLVEEVYLNSRPPLFPKPVQYLLMAVICLLLGIFLWAFTGKSSPLKNHVAIIFSYLIIILFLALPLLAPVILPLASPEALEVMKRTPVGLVVTKVKLEQEVVPQWSLNIGGHVVPTAGEQGSPVEVQGGLIVPLYIIVLSVIGGAINMTRQVPKFQGEGEAQEGRPRRRMNDHSSMDAPLLSWRIELLNQYMFLISAPFLAIATYYMLIWLDLTKVPVIVLVAFSVGLISEPILCTITDTAVRLLRHQPPPVSAAAGGGHATQNVTTEPALVK